MLNPETGWINESLRAIGVANPPNWLNDTHWVYPALVILGIWGIGNAMLIFLASLQGVPTELYDAAKIDGAGSWSTLCNVTFPMISPVIFYNVTLTIVGLFQYFTVPLVLNQGTGAPGGATMFYNLYLYKTFFTYQNMAYGATMAWFLFAIILVVTLVLFGTQKYWVFYTAESRYTRISDTVASIQATTCVRRETVFVAEERLMAVPRLQPIHEDNSYRARWRDLAQVSHDADHGTYRLPVSPAIFQHVFHFVEDNRPDDGSRRTRSGRPCRGPSEVDGKTLEVYEVPMPDGSGRTWRSSRRDARRALSSIPDDPEAARLSGRARGVRSIARGRRLPTWSNF